MYIYVTKELSDLISESDKKYFRAKIKGDELYFSKLDKIDNKFLQSNIVFGNIAPPMIEQSKNLEWVQLESTGFSEYMYLEKLNKEITITNLKGFFAKQVAQTALASILAIYRGIIKTENLKKKRKWVGDPIRSSLSILDNKYVVLIGNGSINKFFKNYIKPFNCKIISFNSKSKKDNIIKHLRKAELVISALPGTSKTNNFFNKSKLNSLNKNCIFVNVGRGNSVDENHLIQILKKNQIRGAALDVTNDEPLKKNSILWSLDNIVLTQHSGGGLDTEIIDKIDFFLDNLKRFKSNKKKLTNIVSLSKGY
tara:strand:+ start:6389 stop:7318 length:930 start_codon:yes stop_codon:yes gene_type:complete